MTVYQAIVQIGAAHPGYVSVTLRSAKQTEVRGLPMAETVCGYIEPIDNWHDTPSDAYAAAAEQIAGVARDLFDRADELRGKAAVMRLEAVS